MADFGLRLVADALRDIATPGRDPSNPAGLEALTMALCGGKPNENNSVSAGLFAIAHSLDGLAQAIRSSGGGGAGGKY